MAQPQPTSPQDQKTSKFLTISGVSANPSSFSPSHGETTTISYTLSEAASNNVVTIRIYDSDFNLVRTVSDASGNSGPNSWVWDGKDDNGNILQPDKYIFVIEATDTGENRCEKAHRNKLALEKGAKIDISSIVTIAKPAVDGEYVSGVVFIEVFAESRKGIKEVAFYVDGTFKGYMYKEADYWRFDWDTSGTSEGNHTIKAEATDNVGNKGSATRPVYVHPKVQIQQISFKDGHVLYDLPNSRVIEAPQWVLSPTKDDPAAYTINNQMKIEPQTNSTNVTSLPVYLQVTLSGTWSGSDALKWADGSTENSKVYQVSSWPFIVTFQPAARYKVSKPDLSLSWQFEVRKSPDSDWAPAGSQNTNHSKIYLTWKNPLYNGEYWAELDYVKTCPTKYTKIMDWSCGWAAGRTAASQESAVRGDIFDGAWGLGNQGYKYIFPCDSPRGLDRLILQKDGACGEWESLLHACLECHGIDVLGKGIWLDQAKYPRYGSIWWRYQTSSIPAVGTSAQIWEFPDHGFVLTGPGGAVFDPSFHVEEPGGTVAHEDNMFPYFLEPPSWTQHANPSGNDSQGESWD